jgi:HD-like signal output (HDOD) protein
MSNPTGDEKTTAIDLINGADLPSLPEAFFKLQSAIDSKTSDRDQISRILMRDPAICARTLKLANSAYVMSNQKIETIDDAVKILGTDTLVSIAMAVYIIESFSGIDSNLMDMKKFWKQSIRMAIAVKTIAHFCLSISQYSDRYYIAGLLSRIGKLVLYVKYPEIAEGIIKQANNEHVPKFIIEEKILGFTHADISYELLKLWSLPPSIYEPIPHYIYPDNVPNEHLLSAYLMHAAYYMQFAWFHNGEANYIELPSEPNDIAFKYLRIETIDLIACTSMIDDEFELVCNYMDID